MKAKDGRTKQANELFS